MLLSESVLTTADYVLQRNSTKSKRQGHISDLLNIMEVLPCSTHVCRKALTAKFNDLEDSILYQVALEHNMDYFITNDKLALKKLASPLLPVVSTKNFLGTI